jgi:hypothetical protein
MILRVFKMRMCVDNDTDHKTNILLADIFLILNIT